MLSSWKAVICVVVLAYGLLGQSALAADQAGYLLIDKLVVLFNQMASSQTASYEQVNTPISEMMVLARQARAEKRIDQQFFDRYARILRIIKLAIIEDNAEILLPISGPECAAFVKDITGQKVEGATNLSALAQAITKELDNLKKYLDKT
jgi:hypothetical protein